MWFHQEVIDVSFTIRYAWPASPVRFFTDDFSAGEAGHALLDLGSWESRGAHIMGLHCGVLKIQ
jgi:hypothetical protein